MLTLTSGRASSSIGARAQDLQHGAVEPRDRPALCQMVGQPGVDLVAPRGHAPHHVVKERHIGFEILLVLDLRTQPVHVELVEQRGERCSLHL